VVDKNKNGPPFKQSNRSPGRRIENGGEAVEMVLEGKPGEKQTNKANGEKEIGKKEQERL